jgi:hypothetical protein
MRARSSLPVLLCALLASCSAPVEPVSGGFVGDWATEREALSPAGTHENLLSMGADGRFAAESRMYGAYPGQPADRLSASSRTEGSYRAEDGRLRFEPESLTTFDTFEGRAMTTVHRPYPYGGVYEGAKYEVDGDRLTLTYLTYPADAPVETRRTFRRTLR